MRIKLGKFVFGLATLVLPTLVYSVCRAFGATSLFSVSLGALIAVLVVSFGLMMYYMGIFTARVEQESPK